MATGSSAAAMLRDLQDVGKDRARGGYSRPVFSPAELELREWFIGAAVERGLDVEVDGNGLMWAWWDGPQGVRTDAVTTGSHLDSVPGGGAFDGPLGVVTALAAVDQLKSAGFTPSRPLAVVVFPEEEGSRFGVPCVGSGLLTGTLAPARALGLKDASGQTLAEVLTAHGFAPEAVGPDRERLDRIGCFVELHVEQGRGLVDLGEPVSIGRSIVGHGRWRLRLDGQGNHAGTTAMPDRRDPMIAAAHAVLETQRAAAAVPGARATVGKLVPTPGGSNVIASSVDVWLDVRHSDDTTVRRLVEEIEARTAVAARSVGCQVSLSAESFSPTAAFDATLAARLGQLLPGAPHQDTGAGHDAGVLAPFVPTAMMFVRNPSGVSHAPEEHAEDADIDQGTAALATVLRDLCSS